MKFEHLIRVNDPSLTDVDFLTRDQLWLGLVAKAYKPQAFNPTLEAVEIIQEKTSETLTVIHRRLDFGAFALKDSVELHPMTKTVNLVPATNFCGDCELVIEIEEPETRQFFLRFSYKIGEIEEETPSGYSLDQFNEARKQAYRAADIDAVKVIRAMAQMNPPMDPASTDPTLH